MRNDALVTVMRAWASALAFVAGCLVLSAPVADAALGGTATRGDNCTPINAYAIGYPMSPYQIGPGTIVNESVILSRGWLVAGWVLVSRDGHLSLVPYHVTGNEVQGLVAPLPLFALPSASIDDVRKSYNADRSRLAQSMPALANVEFLDDLGPFIVAPCFAAGLPSNA